MQITSEIKITNHIIKDNILRGIELIGTHIGDTCNLSDDSQTTLTIVISLANRQVKISRDAQSRISFEIFNQIMHDLLKSQTSFNEMTADELTIAIVQILDKTLNNIQ